MSYTHQNITLACAADNFFAMPLAVTVYSVIANLTKQQKIDLFILDGGVTQNNKKKVIQTLKDHPVEIHWLKPVSKNLEKLYTLAKSTYPIAAYYRLLLPEIIPDNYKKIIYLDTDIIFLTDIEKLWNLDMGDYPMLAAMDAANRHLLWPQHLKHLKLEEQGITEKDRYLQSGVLVIDLEKWREQKIIEKFFEFLSTHLELPYPDMDALNFVLLRNWGELDPRWNQIPVVYNFESWQDSPYTEEELSNVVNNPYVIHYGSKPKPWDYRCTHPLKSLWYDYLNQTAWSGWKDTPINHSLGVLRRIFRRLNKNMRRVVQ
ncbi:MAG: glycosyltransferase family 8 protein [Crocosphaera sp.]|nr:glycosyltransferase family 8 protein [Crocosphaera sp.]